MSPRPDPASTQDPAAKDVRSIIGQCFIIGIPGPRLDDRTRGVLTDLQPGGVILFARNYTDPDTLRALCDDLHALDPDDPPLVALDHEGGRVHRLRAPFTHFPSAARIGETSEPRLAFEVGTALGHELRNVGVDIDFAPVLDVFSNPDNTVIGDRAFGADPDRVAEFGCALAAGLRSAGVLPCGKHFPGHGATLLDSHDALPCDERPQARLKSLDLPPFEAAIAQDIEMLMTAHVVYPALDPDRPASLSPIVMHDLLRQRLGFRGVIVSDDLEMGAIARTLPLEDACVRALAAGSDMLLICHSLDRALPARDACERALNDGRLRHTRIREAHDRIRRLKQRFAARPDVPPRPIGASEHIKLAAAILRHTPD